MLYCAELFAFNCAHTLENVHILACKRFLMYTGACNDVARGDLKMFLMQIVALKMF